MLGKIVREVKALRLVLVLLLVLLPLLALAPQGVMAATTANVTVNATPAYVSITCNVTDYDFGVVAASSTTNTSIEYFGITNASTVQTDQTIGMTSDNWTGGVVGWAHSDTNTPGADTVGLLSNNGTWGTGDVILKNGAPWNYVYENKPAGGSYTFGLGLNAPTSFTDGVEKTNTVQIYAVQG